jgi:hypothetical protein
MLGPWLKGELLLAVALFVCAFSSTSRAQDVDEASRSAARDLGYEGVDLLQKGDAPAASERLERAYEVLRVPSIGLWSARALAESGKLIEASERYLEISRLPKAGDVAVQDAAKADATRERDALLPRIPAVIVNVDGAAAGRVTLDGTAIPRALLGVRRPVNPGSHHIVAGADDTLAQDVTLKEGETKTVVLTFTPLPTLKPAAPAAVAPPMAVRSAPPQRASSPGGAPSGQRIAGWALIGVGGAGLVAGGVAGVLALGKKSSIKQYCHDDACLPPAHGAVDTYNGLRTVSSVGFVVGLVGAAAGTTLLLTLPHRQRSALLLRAGLGSVEFSGKF